MKKSRVLRLSANFTARKVNFSITDFFSKYDQICSFLRVQSHLLKKSVMENCISCAVFGPTLEAYLRPCYIFIMKCFCENSKSRSLFLQSVSSQMFDMFLNTCIGIKTCSPLRENCPNAEFFLVRIQENTNHKKSTLFKQCPPNQQLVFVSFLEWILRLENAESSQDMH